MDRKPGSLTKETVSQQGNLCAWCRHRWLGVEGGQRGHCYMFEHEPPHPACAQFRADSIAIRQTLRPTLPEKCNG